jgi:hypothetical protein
VSDARTALTPRVCVWFLFFLFRFNSGQFRFCFTLIMSCMLLEFCSDTVELCWVECDTVTALTFHSEFDSFRLDFIATLFSHHPKASPPPNPHKATDHLLKWRFSHAVFVNLFALACWVDLSFVLLQYVHKLICSPSIICWTVVSYYSIVICGYVFEM